MVVYNSSDWPCLGDYYAKYIKIPGIYGHLQQSLVLANRYALGLNIPLSLRNTAVSSKTHEVKLLHENALKEIQEHLSQV